MSYRSVLLPYENIELILVARQVDPVPTRNAPPGLLRRAGWRATGKIRPRPRATLSTWPRSKGAARRRLLNDAPLVGRPAACPLVRALPHGHGAAVRGTLRTLRVARLLAPHRSPPRARVLALAPPPSQQRFTLPPPRARVLALLAARILAPGSQLAPARGRAGATAPTPLAAPLGLGPLAEHARSASLDGLLARPERLARGVAKRPLAAGALGLDALPSGWREGRAGPLATRGQARDGTRTKRPIACGLLGARAGWPGSVAGFAGHTAAPSPGGGRRGRRGAGGSGLPPWCGWGSGGGGPRRGFVRQGRRRGGTGSVPGAAPPSALWGMAAQGTSRGSTRRTWWKSTARPPLARG